MPLRWNGRQPVLSILSYVPDDTGRSDASMARLEMVRGAGKLDDRRWAQPRTPCYDCPLVHVARCNEFRLPLRSGAVRFLSVEPAPAIAVSKSLGVACAGLIAISGSLFGGNMRMILPTSAMPAMAATLAPGARATFAYLARQNSNSCGLQMASVESYPNGKYLQGSCCSPMNWDHYRMQVGGLRKFRHVVAIPTDPYSISAALAKRLLAYDHSIRLDRTQQAVYERAIHIAPEKGPCCCHCWRWNAFRGMSRYLIARVHFNAHQVARVISLADGCGGK